MIRRAVSGGALLLAALMAFGTSSALALSAAAVSPPTITKAFGATTIPVGGATTLTFTFTNPNASTTLTGIAVADGLPAGLEGDPAWSASTSCPNGRAIGVSQTTVTVTNLTLAPNSSCTVTVQVRGTTAGVKSNTTGAITSVEGGTGGTATASITVVAPPVIVKAFTPSGMAPGGQSTLTISVTNPNPTVALTNVSVSDFLPAGLTYLPPTFCDGFLTGAVPVFTWTVESLAPGATCDLTIPVSGSTVGTYVNTTSNVISGNGGTGTTASATLTIALAPTITKAFSATTMALGGTRTLTFTLMNPNATMSLSGVTFTDALPAGLIVANQPGVSSTCGGIVTAVAGSGFIALTDGTIGLSTSCTVAVDVAATTAGVKVNTTGPVSASQSGTGLASNTATVAVYPPSTIASFSPASGPVGTRLTIRGSAFTGATSAAVNGTALTGWTVVDDTTISGIVAAGTTSGKVTVTTPGGTAMSAGVFTVTLAPTVTAFSPLSGRPGTVVTITGTSFQYVRAVTFGGKSAGFTVKSPTTIVATIPVGAVTGPIVVASPYGVGSSTRSFIVPS